MIENGEGKLVLPDLIRDVAVKVKRVERVLAE